MERNHELERVGALFVGDWQVRLSNMWWEEPGTVKEGTAHGAWIDHSFVRFHAFFDGKPSWDFVFGRSDANDRFIALYHDERGVLRVFDLTLSDDEWVMARTDPDMHQKMNGRVVGERMVGTADASEDAGKTWRKDFDLVFERR